MFSFIPDSVQEIIIVLLCGVLPGVLSITAGIRHWIRKEVSGAVIPRGINVSAKAYTIYGEDAVSEAKWEIFQGFGCLLFVIFPIIAPFMVDWIDAVYYRNFASLGPENKIAVLLVGSIPGILLAACGIFMWIKRKTYFFKFEFHGRFRIKSGIIEGEPAVVKASEYVFWGLLLLILDFILLA